MEGQYSLKAEDQTCITIWFQFNLQTKKQPEKMPYAVQVYQSVNG